MLKLNAIKSLQKEFETIKKTVFSNQSYILSLKVEKEMQLYLCKKHLKLSKMQKTLFQTNLTYFP